MIFLIFFPAPMSIAGILASMSKIRSVSVFCPVMRFSTMMSLISDESMYISSLPAITSIWRYGIELKNHERIPLSRSYYHAVQNALLNWASLL